MGDKRFSESDCLVLESVLRHRRDVRGNRFTKQPLSDTDLDRIVDAALAAPSVGFSQPWEFIVVRDAALKGAIRNSFDLENAAAGSKFVDDRADRYRHLKLEGIEEAPVNLAVFYRPVSGPVLGQTRSKEVGLYSVICAVQNIWLMARAMNIGVGWVSILDPQKVKEILSVPADRELIAYLCIGHVSEFASSPELESLGWAQRKPRPAVIYMDSFNQTPKVC